MRNNIGTDYKTFLRKDSSGLTKVGQILFQESTQVYVYCILAAQVKSRFKIVNDGVKSLQTQQIFQNQLVQEKIVANDLTKLISDFRVAVADSNVRLNFCISPGLVLIPADMKFIKNIAGYNNLITVAKIKQKFGVNSGVNRTLKKSPPPTNQSPVQSHEPTNQLPTPTNQLPPPTKDSSSKLTRNLKDSLDYTSKHVIPPSSGPSNMMIFLTTLLATGLVRFVIFLI